MKKTLVLILFIVLAAASACSRTDTADEPNNNETVYKVGIIQYANDPSLDQTEKAVEEELTAKGSEYGVTFEFAEYTYIGTADPEALSLFAENLVENEVDLIIPITTPATEAVKEAVKDTSIPVVFAAISDPLGAGFVESLEEPGGNMTGTSDTFDTEGLFNLIFAADPDIQKIGLLYDLNQESSEKPIKEAKEICDEKGIEYVEMTGTTEDEVVYAAKALISAGAEAVFTPTDNTFMISESLISDLFLEAEIPHYGGADSFAENGAFLGYGANYSDLGTAAADIAVDILVNNADPAKIPVKPLNNKIATVNTPVAEALGIDYSSFSDLCEMVIEVRKVVAME